MAEAPLTGPFLFARKRCPTHDQIVVRGGHFRSYSRDYRDWTEQLTVGELEPPGVLAESASQDGPIPSLVGLHRAPSRDHSAIG
jgi:hypothetical protein